MNLLPKFHQLTTFILLILIAGNSLFVMGQSHGRADVTSQQMAELTIDVDGDGTVDALTDGLLLLRYMFGLSGDSLIAGVVSENATYKTEDELIGRISNLGNTLDVDNNGEIDALTDGLIILRYLFGLDGEALIANVVSDDGERQSAADIQAHLEELLPPEPGDIGQPNIILIISDDQGLDSSAQYNLSADLPVTPHLDQLAASGITFDNAWATPACTTTRSTIITGKYGVNSGVLNVGDIIPSNSVTLQKYLKNNTSTANYASAVIGKWHLGGNSPAANHPSTMGVDYYAGSLRGAVNDYESWTLTINGQTSQTTTYHTTKVTDLAIDWIDSQAEPWFLWLAYVAPHTPFHLPPQSLHTQNLSGTDTDINANPRNYYLAAIEAMDTEIGRLMASMTEEERDNTIIFYVGDNGTPRQVADRSVYANGSKGNLTQGGLAVPMIASGAGVSRKNVREDALISSTDFFATIASMAGSTVSSIEDSMSFKNLLTIVMPPIGIISIATFQVTISQDGLSEIQTINLSVPRLGKRYMTWQPIRLRIIIYLLAALATRILFLNFLRLRMVLDNLILGIMETPQQLISPIKSSLTAVLIVKTISHPTAPQPQICLVPLYLQGI